MQYVLKGSYQARTSGRNQAFSSIHASASFGSYREYYVRFGELTQAQQVAHEHLSAFEKLIDAYALIGEAMPRFDRFVATFKEHADFQIVVSTFYADILEFHRCAYKYVRRRG